MQFRVGAPPLYPHPVKTTFDEVTSAIADRFGKDFVEEAERVLSKYGIDYHSDNDEGDSLEIDFATRYVPDIPNTAQPTLKIEAP